MRTVFLGTPEIAIPTLRALADIEALRPAAVFSQPPARRSRRGRAAGSPVAVEARRIGIPVHEVEAVSKGEAFIELSALKPDVIVVVAFGQILKRAVLELPRHGCLNFHPSMLPAYRGAAPVPRAILDGVVDSGLTIMRLVKRLDAGPVLMQRPWRMDPMKNADELLEEAGLLGAPMMVDVLGRLDDGVASIPQDDDKASYAPPLKREDGVIDLTKEARAVVNRVRAVQPWPRAELWLTGRERELRILVHRAEPAGEASSEAPGTITSINSRGIVVACGSGSVHLLELQLEGKPRRPARDVANGLRLKTGERFIA